MGRILYLLSLGRLFGEHASSCLPEEVASQGLKVIWRGHSKEKLDALLESERNGGEIPPCLSFCDGRLKPSAPLRAKL
ncbi:hypothetical protein AK812_SmicGene1169 [Symbiodinium microadriaticum]|uniref:Uncharacterized protein n=1 Tax=Symbiodinium microadriaticum TaxID=2951 RepID=A0A1Q9F4N1_SYMMI|nr:hypothetical protein AK812_SmicGene1169 [Symbiodinium microadriaticum]